VPDEKEEREGEEKVKEVEDEAEQFRSRSDVEL
jgi:hypothetical protein